MTSSRASRFRPWDVVLVPFPYTEQARSRQRPAVVVSTAALSSATHMYYVAMITNAAHEPWAGDVLVSDLKASGLPIASVIRPAKIATLDEMALVRRLGVLPRPDRARVSRVLRNFMAIGHEAP